MRSVCWLSRAIIIGIIVIVVIVVAIVVTTILVINMMALFYTVSIIIITAFIITILIIIIIIVIMLMVMWSFEPLHAAWGAVELRTQPLHTLLEDCLGLSQPVLEKLQNPRLPSTIPIPT